MGGCECLIELSNHCYLVFGGEVKLLQNNNQDLLSPGYCLHQGTALNSPFCCEPEWHGASFPGSSLDTTLGSRSKGVLRFDLICSKTFRFFLGPVYLQFSQNYQLKYFVVWLEIYNKVAKKPSGRTSSPPLNVCNLQVITHCPTCTI